MRLLAAAALALAPVAAPAQDLPTVRVGVLAFGTVNWLMDVIDHHGLDAAAGYELETVGLAGRPATTVAFQAGDVDVIVADWIWALRQREQGRDVRYFPYSRALGRLMTNPDSGIETLCDLGGRTVGVVGGELDKSWLVYQALALRDCGELHLPTATETLFGAPPLMSQQLSSGAVEAVSTYWHFAARLKAAGAEVVTDVDEAVAALGIQPTPPLIGFLWNADRTESETVAMVRDSVLRAGEIMQDDAEWERLRPRMNAENDAEFRELREAFQAGIITARWTEADTEAARALHETMLRIGGEGYAEEAGPFDPQIFAE
jgi:NitT/TauT family transport system substrate-binding protein